jgi:hypothetical protein
METKKIPAEVLVLDLTNAPPSEATKTSSTLKAPVLTQTPTTTPVKATGQKRANSSISTSTTTTQPRARKKNDKPHVLIWICHHGHGDRGWKMKNPKVIGVYGSKEEAEAKKNKVMENYEQCGHGDIATGDSWEDEIDLLIRPADECTL